MATKRHQENLAVSGDGIAFAELKRLKSEMAAEAPRDEKNASGHEIVQHDHHLDRSETGDALQRAVDRVGQKRGQDG